MRAFWTEPSDLTQATVWPLLQRAVEDAEERETTEERRGVEVGDVRLQGVLVVVASAPARA